MRIGYLVSLRCALCLLLATAFMVLSPSPIAEAHPNHQSVRDLPLVPFPNQVTATRGRMALPAGGRIVATDARLAPLGQIVAHELFMLTGLKLPVVQEREAIGDIVLRLDPRIEGEAYRLTVSDRATISGGNYNAVAMGTVTLLQALDLHDGEVSIMKMRISDAPRSSYRGLLVDVARNWHDIDTLKQLIVLCRWYKINYIQLHLTDDQSFTFPSQAFPKLATPGRHYTLEQLRDLDEFAARHGVLIVPEFESPGHASQMTAAMPELFAIRDRDKNPSLVNMGREEVYVALDTIVGEMCEVFRHSPYFHIGGDEAWLAHIDNDPDAQAYMKQHDLPDVQELYRHFLVRMNESVKKHGKKTLLWEGFHRGGQIDIPRDITVFAWETAYQRPEHLLEDGYTIINASWQPLYIVNDKHWTVEHIYNWNIFRWEHFLPHFPSGTPIQVEPTDQVIGAQLCAWEQPQEIEFESIRRRLAAMSERAWSPDLRRDYEDFANRLEHSDDAIGRIVFPVTIGAANLADRQRKLFSDAVDVRLHAMRRGVIRYTLDGSAPTAASPAYESPLRLTETTTVQTALFVEGKQVGHVTRETYTRITPRWHYAAYRLPRGQDGLPDLDAMQSFESGETDIAYAKERGYDRMYAMRFIGAYPFPADGEYKLRIWADGPVRVRIDGKEVARSDHNVLTIEPVFADPFTLTKGEHKVEIDYYCIEGFSELHLTLEGPEDFRVVPW